MFLDRHSIDQRSVSAFKITDGELPILRDKHAVSAGQYWIGNPEVVGRLPPDRDICIAHRKNLTLKTTSNAEDPGIHVPTLCCYVAHSEAVRTQVLACCH